MTAANFIASLALLLAIVSVLISWHALRESRKSNRIALISHRSAIYDAFRAFSREASIAGQALQRGALVEFAPHAEAARKFLPGSLGDDVYDYFEDCQFVVDVAPRINEIDDFAKGRWEESLYRMSRNGFSIESRILEVVRDAAND